MALLDDHTGFFREFSRSHLLAVEHDFLGSDRQLCDLCRVARELLAGTQIDIVLLDFTIEDETERKALSWLRGRRAIKESFLMRAPGDRCVPLGCRDQDRGFGHFFSRAVLRGGLVQAIRLIASGEAWRSFKA